MRFSDYIKLEDRLYALNRIIENAMYSEGVNYKRDISPLEEERKRVVRDLKKHKDEVLSFDVNLDSVRNSFLGSVK